MKTYKLLQKQFVPLPLSEVFRFFENPANLEKITPPNLGFKIKTPSPLVMKTGLRIDYTIRLLGCPVGWTSEISSYNPPYEFVDDQVKGPYRLWHHRHTFAEENGGTLVTDEIDYALSFDIAGIAHALFVKPRLDQIFRFRRQFIENYFQK